MSAGASESNVDVVRRLFETYRRGDYADAVACLAPDVVYEVGQELPATGPDAVVEMWKRWDSTWEDLETVPEEFVEAGNQVVVTVRYSARGRGSGIKYEERLFDVYTLRDGRCVHKVEFRERSDALKAAGMPEIRPPRRDELEALRAIERDAGQAFAAIGMPEVAADEPPPLEKLKALRAAGHAWVAVNAADRPAAYLLSSVVDGCAHVDQVSVASSHARRGLGAALIEHLAAGASAEGRPALTLTAFRDVPWNAPYYARLGFDVVEPADQGPELAALVAREAVAIPGDAPRVAMRRALR
jgi:ketosteroid isomerase-like protein/GNAT superfamily N-acetyltransferase